MDVRRLACYGWVGEHAGSVASANYVVLRELLERGIEVDLYAHRNHVPRPEGLGGTFRYFGFEPPPVLERLPAWPGRLVGLLGSPIVRDAWRRVYEPTARAEHRRLGYDAVLSLGTTPAFTLPGVPTVTWLQGPLQTELEAIRRLRPQIVATSGLPFYLALVSYYRLDLRAVRGVLDSSARIVCGSEWARRALVEYGIDSRRAAALPYPIDLETFAPAETTPDLESPMILALGRLDPRKRLDLLLDAFTSVRDAIPGARLRVVGRPGYAPRQLAVLDRHPVRAAVDYEPAVPRRDVPALLREAAVLVQPSENENFGSSVAEALACGTPVVVGASNGTADYVDESSRVFERYDSDAVARAILDVLETRQRDPDGVRASTRGAAVRHFAPSAVVDGLLEVIDGAVDESRTAVLA